MKIITSSLTDIPEIFSLYRLAMDYQKMQFPGNQWSEFDKSLIVKEGRQFKLILENEIACIRAVTFHDVYIWEEKENNSSIYLHRIATNPAFRGRNFVKNIVDWAKDYAASKNKEFVRMDTCSKNKNLINHYKKYGFDFLEMKKLKDTSKLPLNYHDAEVCFLE